MLYTLLVGSPPFDTDAVKSTLTKVVMAEYKVENFLFFLMGIFLRLLCLKKYFVPLQMPMHLSAEARDLIDKLLKKNPYDRIKLSEILEHPFLLRDVSSSNHDILKEV